MLICPLLVYISMPARWLRTSSQHSFLLSQWDYLFLRLLHVHKCMQRSLEKRRRKNKWGYNLCKHDSMKKYALGFHVFAIMQATLPTGIKNR